MEAKIETITPLLARSYLDLSRGNRSLKAAKVASYARDIASGSWAVNGEAVIFSDSGELLDGHHRLTACIDADQGFQTLVVRGVEHHAQKTIDMGASRTLGDVLTFTGEKNANALASAVNAAVSIANGRPRSANLSSTEMIAFINEYPKSRDFACDSVRKAIPRAGSILSGIGIASYYTGRGAEFDKFLEVLNTGIPSRVGCPAHSLRDRVMRDAGHRRKMTLHEVHRLCVNAWNKFISGNAVVKISKTGKYEIVGWRPAIVNKISGG